MIRLHVVAEGQTEEHFANLLLREHLAPFDVFLDVRCVETSRSRRKIYRGGMLNYGKAKKDLIRWMKEDASADARFTTMFDLYALPTDFPNYALAARERDPYQRVSLLERSFKEDIGRLDRFVPYVQLHEFEALLFADIDKLSREFTEHIGAIKDLNKISKDFSNPELINDKRETAPSKRIIGAIPQYEGRKVSAGPKTADAIGLLKLREKCRHFNEWVSSLERLKAQTAGR